MNWWSARGVGRLHGAYPAFPHQRPIEAKIPLARCVRKAKDAISSPHQPCIDRLQEGAVDIGILLALHMYC